MKGKNIIFAFVFGRAQLKKIGTFVKQGGINFCVYHSMSKVKDNIAGYMWGKAEV